MYRLMKSNPIDFHTIKTSTMKNIKTLCTTLSILAAGCLMFAGTPVFANVGDVMIQGFDWGAGAGWWSTVGTQASTLHSAGFNVIWLPPCGTTVDKHGYLPNQWYDLNDSPYGNQAALVG